MTSWLQPEFLTQIRMTHPTIPLASKTHISRLAQKSETSVINADMSNSLKYLRPMFSEMLPLHGWYLNPAGSFKGGDDVIGGSVHFWPRFRVAKEKDGRNTREAVRYSGGKDKRLEMQWPDGTRDQILRNLQVMDHLNQNHAAKLPLTVYRK